MVVHDLPRPVHLPPHVREPRLHRLAVLLWARHEGVEASVQVGVSAVALDVVSRDSAVGQLLEKLHEVLLGGLWIADELGGDRGEEGEIGGGIEGCNLLEVFLLERVIPTLEVILPGSDTSQ